MLQDGDTIVIGPFRYMVAVNQAAIERERVEGNKDLKGSIEYSKTRIVIDPECAEDDAACTLLHEILHGISDMVGLNDGRPHINEDWVNRMAPPLLDTLRRNPALREL